MKRFEEFFGRRCQAVYSAAGRVNLIGEHVDYCGGKALPLALSMKSRVYASRRNDGIIRLAATTTPIKVELDLSRIYEYKGLKWGSYQAGVVSELLKKGKKVCGCDLLFDVDIPFGAGLSSSAAIEVSTALAVTHLSGIEMTPYELALLSQKAERDYVGVKCGLMDQLISAEGKKDCALLVDFATLKRKYVKIKNESCRFVILNTNKPRALVSSKYNERFGETQEALRRLRKKLDIEFLAQATPKEIEENRDLFSDVLYKRAMHVVKECERVERFAESLERGDIVEQGRLMNESHYSLRNLYEVTGRELDVITESARNVEGCLGARMTGAGFGGCAVCLVEKDKEEKFKEKVLKEYKEKTGFTAVFYDCNVSDGIAIEEL